MYVKVYRYESPNDGLGPYNSNDSKINLYLKRKLINKHIKNNKPSIENDGLDFAINDNNFKTACNTLKELKKWFKGYNKKLINSGFIIVEYIVKYKIDGKSKKQCIFHIDNVIKKNIIETKKSFLNIW